MALRPQRVRDPVHNLIEFDGKQFEGVIWSAINTRPFQRLRRIKQLGFSDNVYPGATHSRFAHSLGVFHTARILMKIIEKYLGNNYLESDARHALAAALVHDVGHGPFSHAFEDIGKRLGFTSANHETLSDALIRDSEISAALNQYGSGFANDVADVIKSGGKNIYGAVVSSQFDADRLDYVQRDRMMTGTHHGEIDFHWLIANLEVGEVDHTVDGQKIDSVETFVLGPKAIHAAEAYVLGLFQLYPTVYYHKTTRGIEKVFTELMVMVFRSIIDGSYRMTGLPKNHPLVRFAKNPKDINSFLDLDDTVIYGSLCLMSESKDEVIAEFAQRIKERKKFKAINIREQIAERITENRDHSIAVDRACAHVEAQIGEWIGENQKSKPRILTDIADRAPYRQFQESKGPLNQIRIKTLNGRLIDLGERSRVVKGIEVFKLHRVYVAPDDGDACRFVEAAIETGIGNAKRAKGAKRRSPSLTDSR